MSSQSVDVSSCDGAACVHVPLSMTRAGVLVGRVVRALVELCVHISPCVCFRGEHLLVSKCWLLKHCYVVRGEAHRVPKDSLI
jgi:hypothetical protein